MNATITLREYLEKGKTFVIPNYQRGYVWGKKSKKNELDAVSYILEKSLIPGSKNNAPVFIQGITVTEKDEKIILIDGQQRTTFFYLLLKYLGYSGKFKMEYTIREKSDNFLSALDINKTDFSENPKEKFQDLYFFKKTLRTIDDELKKEQIEKEDFLNYILDHVRFLYIDIPEDKATKVFSMMNGSKAEMKSEELIKAELLRLASLNDSDFDKKEEKEKNAIEWDNNMLRSRYAREWDKWLQWWNREDVKKLFKCSNVMGYLVSSLQTKGRYKELSFDNFKNEFLHKQKPIKAKKTFDKLRRLQKRFEDAFNTPKIYNWVGAILRIGSANEFIQWFFVEDNKPSNKDLEKYYKCSFLGLTHKQIVGKDEDKFEEKYEELYKILENNDLYNENPEEAFRLLLRLNIDEDNKQEEGAGRKFDFSIWDRNDSRGRSLEHIYPKSKVLHKELENGKRIIKNGKGDVFAKLPSKSDGYIARASCRCFENSVRIEASEHSIGNLVLLYKDDNSAFNDSSFDEKKSMFFLVPDGNDKKKKMIFKSRHLLHTIYKFAGSNWGGEQIARNKYQTLQEFRKYYGK